MNEVKKRFFPVIHLSDRRQGCSEAAFAFLAGAHGVFLISMSGEDNLTSSVARELCGRYGSGLIGVNYLSLSPADSIRRAVADGVSMLWEDNPGLFSDTGVNDSVEVVQDLLSGQSLEYFGSVAFKTQRPDPRPDISASIAKGLGWTVTTSGPATGIPAEVDKVALMGSSIGSGLAIASGITPENVASYLPHVDNFLVSTGICSDFHHFDYKKVLAVSDTIAGYRF